METVEFRIEELLGVGMTLVVLGIGLAYGLSVVGDIRDDIGVDDCSGRTDEYTSYNTSTHQCQNATAGAVDSDQVAVSTVQFNASQDTISGVAKIPNKLPTIAVVIVAAVIIGVLVTYLWARFR